MQKYRADVREPISHDSSLPEEMVGRYLRANFAS